MVMSSTTRKVRIICISDTHNHAPGEGYTLPKGDVLIHAGDFTNQGSYAEVKKATSWLEKADFAVKIIIAGNHDLSLDKSYSFKHAEGWTVQPDRVDECRRLLTENPAFTYLQHSSAVIEVPERGVFLRVFGSPYSPDRGRQNWAFQYPDEEAEALWDAVPEDIDVLITHTPPARHCDTSKHWQEGGCPALLKALWRVRPVLHVCGHCHEGRGAEIVNWGESQGTIASAWKWEDPGIGTKKQALLDLAGARSGGMTLESGKETAIANASIMAKSSGHGAKAFNKPTVVDVDVPLRLGIQGPGSASPPVGE